MSKHDSRPEVSDELIGDYLDGRLPPEEEAKLRAAIETDPRLAARVEAYRAQDTGLRQLADSVLNEPIPERLRRILESTSKRGSKRTLNVHIAAALLLGLGGAFAAGELDARPSAEPSARAAEQLSPGPAPAEA